MGSAPLFLYAFGMWQRYNNNPCGRSTGDCAVRAVSLALGVGWYEAYDLLCAEGRQMCNMPSGDDIWGAVLRHNGFTRAAIPSHCPDCYTAADFCADHPRGVYVLAFGGHVATVRDGYLIDAWNSSEETPIYYFYRRA